MEKMAISSRLTRTSSFMKQKLLSDVAALPVMSKGRRVILIAALNATVTIGAINTGMLTVLLPDIGDDLHMSRGLLLWPALIYSLTCGCTLLLSGAIADVVGNRIINLVGTFSLSIFILAAGLARSGLQLVIFRGLQGIASSMCFPTAVSILSAAFPEGKIRNIAFGCLGLGTPLGFAMGILVGGWVESTSIRWRAGLYWTAGVAMMLFAINCWCLPHERRKEGVIWDRLKTDVDWVGILLSSISMGLLSYSLSQMSDNIMNLREPAKILLLIIGLATIPLFILWMHVQEKRGKPALIPKTLWKDPTFSAICIMVLLTWATLQGMEWFLSLFYQRVQHLSPIETAVRFMPNIIAGGALNIITGLIIHRISVNYYVVITSALCAISPLLMAIIHVEWSWWYAGFWVNLLLPISVDVNYTVANLLITSIFPRETQALAGAVYQVMSQLGISIGIAILAVISNSVTDSSPLPDKESPDALLKGYRAVFWACFAMMVLSTLVGAWGLRGWKTINTNHNAPPRPPSQASQADIKFRRLETPSFGDFSLPMPMMGSRPSTHVRASDLTSEVPLPPQCLRVTQLRGKPLPQLPARTTISEVETQRDGDSTMSLDIERGAILHHILRCYARREVDANEVHEVLDEYYFRGV